MFFGNGETSTNPVINNKTLIVIRSLYFIIAISHSATYQWSILYFNDYFNLSEFGLIHGMKFLFRFIGSVIWGYFGDYFPNQKFLLFFVGQFICVIFMTALYFLDYLSAYPFFVLYGVRFSQQFIVALVISCGEQFGSSSFALLEAITLILSGKHYGSHRFYVALGHGSGSLLCAIISQYVSHSSFILVYDASIVCALVVLTAQLLCNNYNDAGHEGYEIINDVEDEHDANAGSGSILQVLLNPGFVLMMMNVFIFGIAQSIVLEYLFLFIINEYNAKEIVCGLTTIVMVCGELIIFYKSDYLLTKIGMIGLDLLAHISYIIRAVYYTLLPFKPLYAYFILIVEPLHGFTFAGYWISSVEYMDKLTPVQHKSTVMGILNGVFYGFSYMIGSILGGFMYQMKGAVFMYRVWAIAIFLWMVGYNIFIRVVMRISPTTRRILSGQK